MSCSCKSAMPAVRELNSDVILLEQVYRSYHGRCNSSEFSNKLEKLWWQILDFAALRRSSVTFFSLEEPETAVSRWSRAKTRVNKVVKGLCKDEKAQKLAYKYWLEAIDPRHRYGCNLHLYYAEWLKSESTQPFFHWLDFGDGKEVSVKECPRIALQDQCIQYLGPAIWSYSGHYRPLEENFMEIIRFLEGHHVDLSHVKTFPQDDDVPPPPRKISIDEQIKSDTMITNSHAENSLQHLQLLQYGPHNLK
ncbi:hypothetical protein ACH5RR_024383 [Cinchona calisaya]|uniref:Uncharacterized protein n=1 Tax=Cinchona calisaya TaxID=153742 RepID=A0ABD2YXI1_9GENT